VFFLTFFPPINGFFFVSHAAAHFPLDTPIILGARFREESLLQCSLQAALPTKMVCRDSLSGRGYLLVIGQGVLGGCLTKYFPATTFSAGCVSLSFSLCLFNSTLPLHSGMGSVTETHSTTLDPQTSIFFPADWVPVGYFCFLL